jgi:hypothetical protein
MIFWLKIKNSFHLTLISIKILIYFPKLKSKLFLNFHAFSWWLSTVNAFFVLCQWWLQNFLYFHSTLCAKKSLVPHKFGNFSFPPWIICLFIIYSYFLAWLCKIFCLLKYCTSQETSRVTEWWPDPMKQS